MEPLTGIATTAQLVANVVSTIKAARDLAKNVGNGDLKDRIAEAYDGLLDLRQRLLDVDEENRRLKVELEKKFEIEGPIPPFGYFFDKRYPDQPLCPRCYQSKESCLAYLTPPECPLGPGTTPDRRCRLCGQIFYEG